MDKYRIQHKYWLAAFYLRRALKILEQLTEEQISESPYFVKDVLPNVIADLKKNENWLGIVQDEIQKEILNPEEEDFESALAETTERHGGALRKLADK